MATSVSRPSPSANRRPVHDSTANYRAGIAPPFNEIPPEGAPLTTERFREIMSPLLCHLSSLAYSASVVMDQDGGTLACPMLEVLWHYAQTADTIFERWDDTQQAAAQARKAARAAALAALPDPEDVASALAELQTLCTLDQLQSFLRFARAALGTAPTQDGQEVRP